MKSVIVFDGIQLIALGVLVICLLFLGVCFLLDKHLRSHPNSWLTKISKRIFGI